MTKRSHDPLALHARWLRRMSEYLHTVGERAGAWQLDPAVWTKLYVTLWGDMARDTADWALGADVDPLPEWCALRRVSVHHRDRTAAVPIDVPLAAFGGRRESLTLVTEGLMTADVARVLPARDHIEFQPTSIDEMHRRFTLKLFDLHRVVRADEIYRGMISAKEQWLPLAVVELHVS